MKVNSIFKTKTKLFKYKDKGGWFFLRIEKEIGSQLQNELGQRRGWGSVPVKVTIKDFSWNTSIFPDIDKSYLLPIKKLVRELQELKENELIEIQLQLQGL